MHRQWRLARRQRSVVTPAARPVVENLEGRRLLHGETGFHAHVNFQPANAPVPAGYLVDAGNVYGARGNGLTYGWNVTAAHTARDRNSPNAPDQRYDTLVHSGFDGISRWEIAVPNGTYSVTLAAGDPAFTNSVYKYDVEGVRAIDGVPTSSRRFFTNTVTVTVSDGRLTLANAAGQKNNRISFIDITQVAMTVPFAKVNFQPAGAPVPAGYVADTGLVFANRGNGFSYGWDLDNRSTMRDRNSVRSPDQRFDTLAHTQFYGVRKWEIAIPNGSYQVRLVAGDPDYTNSVYRFSVEGVTAPGGTPTSANRWFDDTVNVTVRDGRLTVSNAPGSDNNRISFVEVYTLDDGNTNTAPVVSAGPNRTVTLPASASLAGTASDDGLPGDTLTSTWSKVSGPGTVTFGNARSPATTASFSAAGTYVLRLTASDGSLSSTDDVTVTVNAAPTAGQSVVRFVLYNATTNQPIPGYDPLPAGATLDLAALPTRNLNVRAFTSPNTVGSVKFGLDGDATYRVENAYPYDLLPTGWTPSVGSHTVTATPYTGGNLAGTAGAPLSITFEVIDSGVQQPATPGRFAWQTKAPSPAVRFEAQGAAVNGRLYVFGGFANSAIQTTARSDVYNPATNDWDPLPNMPAGYVVTHAAVVADEVEGQIYLAGGYLGNHPGPGTAQVWRFDTTDNTWHRFIDLPAARGAGALALLGRDLHFFGGTNGSRTTDVGTHWVLSLDDATPGWDERASMPNARNHLAGLALGGRVYAIGGLRGDDEATGNRADVHAYNPITDTWSAVAPLPSARSHASYSAFALNGRIVVAGGTGNGNVPLADVVEYDPPTNTWVKLPALPAGRKTPVAAAINGRMVVTTGNASSNATPTSTTWVGTLTGNWETGPALPAALGEVAGGVIGNKLYLVGEGSAATLAYDLAAGTWSSSTALARRAFVGNHHPAEVLGGKLYLLGGLGGGSEGKVQIYDPALNRWTLGADMPFAAGSSLSAVIGGRIYVAGGIVAGSSTTDRVARYDPATDTWDEVAPMPRGRNHAASATDGERLYVFGGRGPGSGDANVLENGFDTVQVYDPLTDTWQSSDDPGSTLAPLPQARGGMGKAVFHDGLFYVLGGETLNGAGATPNRVYDRVDVYDPVRNTWRLAAPMRTPRHGIFPLLHAGRIYVAGGGARAGFAQSNVLDVLNLD